MPRLFLQDALLNRHGERVLAFLQERDCVLERVGGGLRWVPGHGNATSGGLNLDRSFLELALVETPCRFEKHWRAQGPRIAGDLDREELGGNREGDGWSHRFPL